MNSKIRTKEHTAELLSRNLVNDKINKLLLEFNDEELLVISCYLSNFVVDAAAEMQMAQNEKK